MTEGEKTKTAAPNLRNWPIGRRRPDTGFRISDPGGFTLIELIVATAISALVIGIVSVCLSFVLRVWQKTANSKPDQTFRMVELLERQLAECDPTPINFEHGSRPLFVGSSNSICFITAHSVKAISKGVPVAVRYTYDSGSGVLSYSELVLNPYRPESLKEFAAGKDPSGQFGEVRSYKVDFPKLAFSYAGKDAGAFSESWDSAGDLPLEILLSWEGADRAAHAIVCMVNAPFPIQGNFLNSSAPGGVTGGLN